MKHQKEFEEEVTRAAINLFTRKQHGHTGEIAYQNGGAALFEKFVQSNSDYYPYHGEINHIAMMKESIAKSIADTETLIIVGPGPATSLSQKELEIIKHLDKLKNIQFIDLSDSFNQQAEQVMQDYMKDNKKRYKIKSHRMDFREAANTVTRQGKTAVISTGTLISNIHNAPLHGFPQHDLEDMLGAFRDLAGDDGYVVLGYDANDDEASLKKAYNQDLAPFINNIMKIFADHAKGLEGFDPAPENFRFESEWVAKARQECLKLVCTKPQNFKIHTDNDVINVSLDTNEEFILVSSLRPTPERVTRCGAHRGLKKKLIATSEHNSVLHVMDCIKKEEPDAHPPAAAPAPGSPSL